MTTKVLQCDFCPTFIDLETKMPGHRVEYGIQLARNAGWTGYLHREVPGNARCPACSAALDAARRKEG